MFDISFSELMIIAVITLLVVGPDKLPHLARTVGAFVGRLQRYVAQVKEEVNREVRFEELQNLQQEIKEGKRKVEVSMMDGVDDIHAAVTSVKTLRKPDSDAVETAVKMSANSGSSSIISILIMMSSFSTLGSHFTLLFMIIIYIYFSNRYQK